MVLCLYQVEKFQVLQIIAQPSIRHRAFFVYEFPVFLIHSPGLNHLIPLIRELLYRGIDLDVVIGQVLQ